MASYEFIAILVIIALAISLYDSFAKGMRRKKLRVALEGALNKIEELEKELRSVDASDECIELISKKTFLERRLEVQRREEMWLEAAIRHDY